jgi:uncharacterized protein YdaU (DUF1376 family)
MPREPGHYLMAWRIDRWRQSTAYTDLTLEEQGAYRNLLDEAWRRGGALPNDRAALARVCGKPERWAKVEVAVMKKFVLVEGVWRNRTIDKLWHQAHRKATKQRTYRERKRGQAWSDSSN